MKTVLLPLTEMCNLNCVYCYETNKKKRKMSYDTAIKIIDSEIIESEEINISFFGGEPFLEFDLMKKIVDHYWNNEKIFFSNSTNGTLIHGNTKEWIKIHRNRFTYSLSFDGDERTQNYNRSNSFSLVDLNFYKELYGYDARVKMTIFPKSVSNLFNSVKFLTEFGLKINANIAYGSEWDNISISLLKEQLLLLIDYFVNNHFIPFSYFDLNIRQLAYPQTEKPWCGIDKLHVYDVNGKKFPCQFFEEVSQNEIIDIEIDVNHLEKYTPDECRKCVFYNLCPICLGSNYKRFKSFKIKDDDLCKLFKLQLFSNAIYRTELIKKYGINNIYHDEIEQKEILKAIKIIAKEINYL